MLIFPHENELNELMSSIISLRSWWWFSDFSRVNCVLKLYMLHCKDNTRLNLLSVWLTFYKNNIMVHCSYGNSFKIIIEFRGNTKVINILYRQHSTEKKCTAAGNAFYFFLVYASILENTHFLSWEFLLLCGTDFTHLNMSKITQIFLNQFNLELHTERTCFVLRFFCVYMPLFVHFFKEKNEVCYSRKKSPLY